MIMNPFIEGQVSSIISCDHYYLHGGSKKVGEITVNLCANTIHLFWSFAVQFFIDINF